MCGVDDMFFFAPTGSKLNVLGEVALDITFETDEGGYGEGEVDGSLEN